MWAERDADTQEVAGRVAVADERQREERALPPPVSARPVPVQESQASLTEGVPRVAAEWVTEPLQNGGP